MDINRIPSPCRVACTICPRTFNGSVEERQAGSNWISMSTVELTGIYSDVSRNMPHEPISRTLPLILRLPLLFLDRESTAVIIAPVSGQARLRVLLRLFMNFMRETIRLLFYQIQNNEPF